MSVLTNAGGGAIVREIAEAIVAARAELSRIDGLIGDGDHGNNMAKGFARAAGRIAEGDTLDDSFATLSNVLMAEIGGSMGPLYGMMFSDMADAIRGHDTIDTSTFRTMLTAGADGVAAVGDARPGDKTMLDALLPAVAAFGDGKDFADRLDRMTAAADAGRDATVDMVARVGRAARLGERSRGVPDAGATSCALILRVLARGTQTRLTPGGG